MEAQDIFQDFLKDENIEKIIKLNDPLLLLKISKLFLIDMKNKDDNFETYY